MLNDRSILAGLALLLIGAALDTAVRTWWRRLRLGWRFQRARRAEGDAETLLTRRGYRIVERQACANVLLTVDGTEVVSVVRADLVVERKGRRAVVEVKTGGRAPDPSYVPTRRQLLEYAVVFPDHDILLVDMEAGDCRIIEFPLPANTPSSGLPPFLLGILVAVTCQWLAGRR